MEQIKIFFSKYTNNNSIGSKIASCMREEGKRREKKGNRRGWKKKQIKGKKNRKQKIITISGIFLVQNINWGLGA